MTLRSVWGLYGFQEHDPGISCQRSRWKATSPDDGRVVERGERRSHYGGSSAEIAQLRLDVDAGEAYSQALDGRT